MPLAYTLAPECIIASSWKDSICVHTVQGEHTRIPAYRNDPYMAIFSCSLIYCRKMLRNLLMCIKAVDHIKPLCIFRCLYRKVCSTASADDQHINLIFHFFGIIYRINFGSFCKNGHILRITACKYCHKLHIRIMFNGTLYSTAKISIT